MSISPLGPAAECGGQDNGIMPAGVWVRQHEKGDDAGSFRVYDVDVAFSGWSHILRQDGVSQQTAHALNCLLAPFLVRGVIAPGACLAVTATRRPTWIPPRSAAGRAGDHPLR